MPDSSEVATIIDMHMFVSIGMAVPVIGEGGDVRDEILGLYLQTNPFEFYSIFGICEYRGAARERRGDEGACRYMIYQHIWISTTTASYYHSTEFSNVLFFV